jgi:methyl-accepting chemotaxis protein
MRFTGVAFKISFIAVVLMAMMVVIGISGYVGMSRMEAAMSEIYQDRVVPVRQMKTISDAFAVTIVDTAHKARSGAMAMDQAQANVEGAMVTIDQEWKAYLATTLTADEKALIAQTTPRLEVSARAARQLAGILQHKDAAALDDFVVRELYPAMDPSTEMLDKLTSYQLTSAQETQAIASRLFGSLTWVMVATVLGAVVIGAALSYFIGGRITGPVKTLTRTMSRMAEGELVERQVAVSRDEIGDLFDAVNVLTANLRASAELADSIAKGDLTVEARRLSDKDVLGIALETML